MWSTLPYLVKVQICFALLWSVYRFFLQRDGRFARSRAYLLLSVPVSFLIPLLSIPVLPASQPAPVPAVPVAAVAEAPFGRSLFPLRRMPRFSLRRLRRPFPHPRRHPRLPAPLLP